MPLSRAGRDPGHWGPGLLAAEAVLHPAPGPGRSLRPWSRLLGRCLVTGQPVAENHSSFPVLAIGALVAQAGTGDFRDQPSWPSFLSTKGFSPCCQRHFSRLLGWPLLPPLSQGNTSYCEHHPGVVRHSPPPPPPPPMPRANPLAAANQFSISFKHCTLLLPSAEGPRTMVRCCLGQGGGKPLSGLWLDRGSWGLLEN